jgi:hypothetical protein
MPAWRTQAAHFAVWWAVCLGAWLMLAGTASGVELFVGGLFALPCAALATFLRRSGVIPFYPGARALRRTPRLVVDVLRDTLLLARHLFQSFRGGVREGRFVAVTPRWPAEAGEAAKARVWLTMAASAAPNTVVVGIDLERGEVLLHQLVAQGDLREDLEALL